MTVRSSESVRLGQSRSGLGTRHIHPSPPPTHNHASVLLRSREPSRVYLSVVRHRACVSQCVCYRSPNEKKGTETFKLASTSSPPKQPTTYGGLLFTAVMGGVPYHTHHPHRIPALFPNARVSCTHVTNRSPSFPHIRSISYISSSCPPCRLTCCFACLPRLRPPPLPPPPPPPPPNT